MRSTWRRSVTSAATVAGDSAEALVVYSGRGEDLVAPVLEDFTEATGIPVEARYGDSPELALLIEEEGERTPADVFFSQSPGATGYLAQADLLAPLDAELLDRVDEAYRSPDGVWIGVSGRQRVLVFHTETVAESELPDSVLDLTDPAYAGRVGLAPTNGSFQDFVTALRQTEGDEAARQWLEGIAANQAATYEGNSAVVEAVGRGEVELGLVNHYYLHRFLAEDPDFPAANHRFAGDDVGALLMPATISVVAGSDQPDAAAELIRYLLSEDAQRYFAEETFEYPLAGGLGPAEGVPPLDAGDFPPYDADSLTGGFEATLALIEEAGL